MGIEFDRVRAEYPCSQVVSRYVLIQKKGKDYIGLCPFHDDHNPSFSVYRGKDGIERFRCFACGEGGDVIDFVAAIEGCMPAEAVKRITGEELPAVGEYKPKKPLPVDETNVWKPIIPVPEDAPPYKPEFTFNPAQGKLKNYKRGLERLDAYRDAEGTLMFWVARIRFSDGKKICPQITYCVGPKGEKKWCAKRMDPPYPLMGLDDLARYPKRQVIVVEGEKCKVRHDQELDAFIAKSPLNAQGNPRGKFVTVSWMGGTKCIDKTDWTPLADREHIILMPDADEPGLKAMKQIREILIEQHGTG